MLRKYFALLRVKQWVKNSFVVAPLFFSGRFVSHDHVVNNLLVATAFCLASSVIYVVNDIRDMNSDRKHPRKKHRPIASGAVSVVHAYAICLLLCLVLVLLVWSNRVSGLAGVLSSLFAYLALNIVYTFVGKRVVIGDAFFIAVGFVLRVMAGSYAVGTSPSGWILVTTFFLSLFLGFGKRRNELLSLRADSHSHRSVLSHYNLGILDQFVVSSGTLAVISYALYTLDGHTVMRFGTDKLVYTVPFVAYAVFRYALVLQSDTDGDPTEIVFRDKGIAIAVLGWIISAVVTIHYAGGQLSLR